MRAVLALSRVRGVVSGLFRQPLVLLRHQTQVRAVLALRLLGRVPLLLQLPMQRVAQAVQRRGRHLLRPPIAEVLVEPDGDTRVLEGRANAVWMRELDGLALGWPQTQRDGLGMGGCSRSCSC